MRARNQLITAFKIIVQDGGYDVHDTVIGTERVNAENMWYRTAATANERCGRYNRTVQLHRTRDGVIIDGADSGNRRYVYVASPNEQSVRKIDR